MSTLGCTSVRRVIQPCAPLSPPFCALQERLLEQVNFISDIALTAGERERNKLGEILAFRHHDTSTETEFCGTTLPAVSSAAP